MSTVVIGGAVVAAATSTKSWGVSPGTTEVTCPGEVSYAVGQTATFNLGGMVVTGVVASVPMETSDGSQTRISLVDQRCMLFWESTYCSFNNEDIRPDDPSTAGIDRQKRFWHILPDDWEAQVKTWTVRPYSAADVLRKILSPFGWSLNTHPDQEKPVYNVDANTGAKLGNVVQRITDEQGLSVTIVNGGKALRWVRKGEDMAPSPPATASRYSSGEALSANDTQVRIVGDRNKYQETSIWLVQDWLPELEAFWSEAAWFAAVKQATGITDDALLAAKAISMTLREAGYKDYGFFGSVCRMEIPVWTYIQNLVFKAYKVPRDFSINGIGIDDLELSEGLLVSMKATTEGSISPVFPREYYPDARAFVIAKGQQLDLFDPRSMAAISPQVLDNANTVWSPVTQFQVDAKNKVILFEHPVFASDSLYHFPNQDVDGISVGNPLYNVAVPNAGATLWAADVQASLVFEAEKFSKTYGSGVRRGSKYVQALNYQALSMSGSFVEEIKYLDGKGAEEKADEYSKAQTSQMVSYESGGYTRAGSGTELTSGIDRVTVSLTFEGGLTESIEFTKEKSESNFISERELERRQGFRELYPGQQKVKTEVLTLNAISKAKRETVKKSAPQLPTLSHCMATPIGAVDCSPNFITSPDTWLAGQPVFLGENGAPAQYGTRFGGIVIANNSTGRFAVATQGIVPVRVQGPISAGDNIGIDPGSGQVAKKNGRNLIGSANGNYGGTDVAILPVRLGVGGVVSDFPFQVILGPQNEGDPTFGVVSDSHVFNSSDGGTYEEDNSEWGLLEDWASDDDQNWATVPEVGSKIWLKFTFNEDRDLIDIGLEYGVVGGPGNWELFPDPIEINTDGGAPFQEFYHLLIAEVTDPDSDPRQGKVVTFTNGVSAKIVQRWNTNVMLIPAETTDEASQPNLPVIVATPWGGPGTAVNGSADELNNGSNIKTPWAYTSTEGDFPFKVKIRSTPDNPDAFDFCVSYNSLLFASPDNEDTVTIDGLQDGDSGWVTWNGSDNKVWLEVEWSDWPDTYTLSIKSESNGDDWGDGEVESDGEDPPNQDHARIVLATITSDDSGFPLVEQRVRTHLQLVGAMEEDGNGIVMDCMVPTAYPSADVLPEFLQGNGNFDLGYDIWLGEGSASFTHNSGGGGPDAAPISRLEIEVQDPEDDTASGMTLIIGDEDGDSNDMLCFTSGDSDSQNEVVIRWCAYPTVLLSDNGNDEENANQINLNIEGGPELYLQDEEGNEISANINENFPIIELNDTDDHTGNQVSINIEAGPEVYLQDRDEGNEITIDINEEYPIVKLKDDGTNEINLNIEQGPELYLEDGDGNEITVNITDAPTVKLTDSGTNEINLNIEAGPELYLEDGNGGEITVNINDYPDISLFDGTNTLELSIDGNPEVFLEDGDGNNATLDAGGLAFEDTEDASNLDAGGITFGKDTVTSDLSKDDLVLTNGSDETDISAGEATFSKGGKDIVISEGDIDLGNDGSITIGAEGNVDVGAASLSDGDLDLGGTGTITIADNVYEPQDIDIYTTDSSGTCTKKTMKVLGFIPSET